MSASVIDKYVAKKEKDLLEYAKILESIITIEDNKMWQNKSDFSKYAKEIIDIYAKTNYFANNVHRDNPIDYSNDNINSVLKAIIEYLKANGNAILLKEWKNEIFLMSVIVCTACYVDFATNVVDGNFKETKDKFKYLLRYLSKTKILHINENKYWLKDLFNLIKKNTTSDQKIFDSMVSDNCYNEYKKISDNYYEVLFKYDIAGLETFDSCLVDNVLKDYEAKFADISLEMLVFHVLRELISNKTMEIYLIKAKKSFKKINLLKYLDNKYIKDYVRLVIPLEDMNDYQKLIAEMSNIGIKVIYECINDKPMDINTLPGNIDIIVSDLFWENNKNINDLANKLNIHFIVKSKEE